MKRILVVDDEAMVALLIANVLKSGGFDVIGPVATVDQAIALLSNETCDGAVLDIMLKHSTSEPIARELTARGLPIVAVTGFAKDQLPQIFSGMPLIHKPFDFKEFSDVVRAAFEKS